MALANALLKDINGKNDWIYINTALTNTEVVVSLDPITIWWVLLLNNNATRNFVLFWNDATATLGTTAPNLQLISQGTGTSAYTLYRWKNGLKTFSTALKIAAASTGGTAASGGPNGTDVDIYMGLSSGVS